MNGCEKSCHCKWIRTFLHRVTMFLLGMTNRSKIKKLHHNCRQYCAYQCVSIWCIVSWNSNSTFKSFLWPLSLSSIFLPTPMRLHRCIRTQCSQMFKRTIHYNLMHFTSIHFGALARFTIAFILWNIWNNTPIQVAIENGFCCLSRFLFQW